MKNNAAERITGFLKSLPKITLEAVVVRLLIAWSMMSVLQNLFRKEALFTSAEFFLSNGFFKSFLVFAALFSMLCLPFFDNKLKPLLFSGFFLMFLLTLSQRNEFGYYLGAVLSMLLISAYVFKDVKFSKDIAPVPSYIVVGIAAGLIAAFVAVITVILYKAFWTPTYDFGIFSQMFFYMKETLKPLTTCERDGLLSHFAVHFSPIYYLLLPVYFIFPSPVTLLVSQGIISVSGVIPVILLCKKFKHSNLTAMFLSICYLGIPAVTGGNLYYLHENVFLAPLLLWMFWAAEEDRIKLCAVFAFLVMLVKEDAPVYVMFFGLYLMLSGRNRRLGSALTGFALLYFVAVIGCIERFGEGAMFGRFDNFSKDGKPANMFGVLMTVFRNPAYFISECFQNDKIQFIIQLFMPVLFIPFMTKKPSRFVLLGPVVLINLMSDYGYQHDMGYQYVFGTAAFVIYLTVMNSADMEKAARGKILVAAAASSVMMFFTMYCGRLDTVKSYKDNMTEHNAIAEAIELVPDDASVAASTFLVANLSQRYEVYELETTKNTADYYVLDLRYPTEQYSVEDYRNENFEEVCVNQYVAIFRRK